ncbi:unnamed protein product, partial [Iphiclides podalirius]
MSSTPVMYTEIPKISRCCFCVPLRLGFLLLAHIKILANIVLAGSLLVLTFIYFAFAPYESFYISEMILTTTLLVLDVTFVVILIVGVHKRNTSMLRLYFRYGIVFAALIVVLGLIWFVNEVTSLTISLKSTRDIFITASSIIAAILIMHVYFLILTHSNIAKIESSCNFKFVNHTSEPECFLQPPFEEWT